MVHTPEWQYLYEGEIDHDGRMRVVFASAGLLDVLGYTLEELSEPDAWLQLIPEGDERLRRDIVQRTVIERNYAGRLRVRARSGERRIFQFHSELEDLPDGRVALHGFARDVTHETHLEAAVREREARLRLLDERVPLVMWTTDLDLRFTWLSGSGIRGRGRSPSEFLGESLFDVFGTTDPSYVPIAAAARALGGAAVTYDVEWEGHSYRATVEPYYDELGTIAGTLGVAIDITAVTAASEEVRDLAREAATLRLARDRAMADQDHPEALIRGSLWIDPDQFIVRKAGVEINLTVTEFKLLVELARRPGHVLSPAVLVERVWGHHAAWNRSSVAMAVKRLRAKIEDDPSNPRLIETVRGVGYRFRAA